MIAVDARAITFKGPMTIFSFLLGDDRFMTVPNTKKATTNQIPIRPRLSYSLKARPDLAMTMTAKNIRMNIWTTAAILILVGSLPG